MGLKVQEILKVDANLELLNGSSEDTIQGLSTFRNAGADHLLFISNKKFFEKYLNLNETNIFVCIDKKYYESLDEEGVKALSSKAKGIITTTNLPISMCLISKPFFDLKFDDLNDVVDGRQMGTADVHPTAIISQNVFVGENVKIGSGTVIHSGCVISSGSVIGENCELMPNVSINRGSILKDNVRIHSGTVIGADGYGYNFDKGVHHKVWHMGGAIIESHVEIGANSCVDQGTFSPTIVGEGTKLDNHVQVAHNVELGRGVIICGQCAIAGSARIGDYTVIGGKAAVGNDLEIGSACQIAGAAMVTGNLEDGAKVGGHPARPLREWLKGVAYLRKNSLK